MINEVDYLQRTWPTVAVDIVVCCKLELHLQLHLHLQVHLVQMVDGDYLESGSPVIDGRHHWRPSGGLQRNLWLSRKPKDAGKKGAGCVERGEGGRGQGAAEKHKLKNCKRKTQTTRSATKVCRYKKCGLLEWPPPANGRP